VKEQRFERMGAFAYCEEEDTFGAKNFADDIPAEIKQSRLDRLMELQERISDEIQQQKVGGTIPVIIDREEGEFYVSRTQWDSPEVDPEVLISKPSVFKPERGGFYNVKITSASPFELMGRFEEDC
ncbi:MAG: 30S ribosomal protein S12 methylthiotransferase RimO, partial [Duncaniella sp.]|nr:30S ribosomal protein S12 methylthiotransferase RimO [Duncaniella sp.]